MWWEVTRFVLISVLVFLSMTSAAMYGYRRGYHDGRKVRYRYIGRLEPLYYDLEN